MYDWLNADWIQTASGGQFFYADPIDPTTVHIEDIAHALSREQRFGGHTVSDIGYSVGQHSVLVSRLCDPEDALWGLLHDAAEAYCKDLPRPFKNQPEIKAGYKVLEARVMRAVCARFGLPHEVPASVHRADLVAVVTEKRDLMSPCTAQLLPVDVPPWHETIIPWGVQATHQTFMRRFREVSK